MKKQIILMAVITIIVLLYGCSDSIDITNESSLIKPTDEVNETVMPTPKPTKHNTPEQAFAPTPTLTPLLAKKGTAISLVFGQGNKQNDFDFIIKDGWIYGRSWNEKKGFEFIKLRADGTDRTVLDYGYVKNIYIKNEYMYYMLNVENGYVVKPKREETNGIYRIRISGTDRQQISDKFGEMQLTDNYIYYKETTEDIENINNETDHLYRCKLDGSGVEEIIGKPVFHWFVFDSKILYQDDRDSESLHIYDLNEKQDKKVNSCASYFPIYDGEFIYYIAESIDGERSINKISPDGANNLQISDHEACGMLLYNNFIYFIDLNDENRIYRMKKDGTDIQLISQDKNVILMQILNESLLKYVVVDDDGHYVGDYICNFDGSGKWRFE